MVELADGDLPDETNGTGVFLVTIRTYPYPFPDRYHSLAMTASAMADCGEVAAELRRRRVPIAQTKLGMSFTGSWRRYPRRERRKETPPMLRPR